STSAGGDDQSGLDTPDSGTSGGVAVNHAPQANAGGDRTISGRKRVTLDGGASSDPDGDSVTFSWKQTSGPAVTLSDADTAQPWFDAPATDENIVLQFELTVSDGERFDTDLVSITVTPPQALVAGAWGNASNNVNGDLNWTLPDGAGVTVQRSGWALAGAESASRVEGLIDDGIHALQFSLDGAGQEADVAFDVDFFEYQFHIEDHVSAILQKLLVIDVQDGIPYLLFNGWLDGSHSESGRPSGVHALEAHGAWRNGSDNVNGELDMRTPDGTWQNVWRFGWARQGFERSFIPAALPMEDGVYRIDFRLDGGGDRSADVVFDMLFGDLSFRTQRRIAADNRRIKVGVDRVNGVPYVIFNGWLEADEDGAGALSGRRPLEAVGAFRNASNTMNVDVDVILPDGAWINSSRDGWDWQAYEFAGLPTGAVLADGAYRFRFWLDGAGQFADVTYQARLGDWSFEFNGLMSGVVEHNISVNVSGGVVTEIANTWP
ncbi:MAG: hypothetical protein D6744_03995, partial [Planctomycetota bacterium]